MQTKRVAVDTLARIDRGSSRTSQDVRFGARQSNATLAKRLKMLDQKLDVAIKDAAAMLAELRAINRK